MENHQLLIMLVVKVQLIMKAAFVSALFNAVTSF